MPVNYSTNKIRVTKLLQSDAVVGLMDPKVGMLTQYGKILGLDSGNYQVTVGVGAFALVGSGTVKQKFYTHQLELKYSVATGVAYGFPGSYGSVQFGHGRSFPSGITQTGQSSGMVELWGDSNLHIFNRPR